MVDPSADDVASVMAFTSSNFAFHCILPPSFKLFYWHFPQHLICLNDEACILFLFQRSELIVSKLLKKAMEKYESMGV